VRFSSGLSDPVTPRLEAVLPELRLTLQSRLSGIRPADPMPVAASAGAALAALHHSSAAGLPAFDASAQLRAAKASASLVAVVAPSLHGRVQQLVTGLEKRLPADEELVPSHGDFNARQLVVAPPGLGIVDFDGLCAASPALDLSTYAAYLVLGEGGDLGRAAAAIELLLDGYDRRAEALRWYLAAAILRRSPRPFRYLDQRWPERLEGMVDAAEGAMGR
jgi:aminoglycoside phosphotransferase (APT) family kinase protein